MPSASLRRSMASPRSKGLRGTRRSSLFFPAAASRCSRASSMSLRWPKRTEEPPEVDDATLSIRDAIDRLCSASKLDAPRALAAMLDHLDASGRFALLKLALGELRVGINARLAKQALAQAF